MQKSTALDSPTKRLNAIVDLTIATASNFVMNKGLSHRISRNFTDLASRVRNALEFFT